MRANVVVCSRTQSEIDSVVKEIKRMMTTDSNNHQDEALLGIRCDVSKSSDVDQLIKLTIANFKFINILINNAGIVLLIPGLPKADDLFVR
jgi:NAD(P)-dependent dehydrogenase (short-subunit alcohol dehydrogenase family)